MFQATLLLFTVSGVLMTFSLVFIHVWYIHMLFTMFILHGDKEDEEIEMELLCKAEVKNTYHFIHTMNVLKIQTNMHL